MNTPNTYNGPAILSYGFRPFFFFGSLWAAFAVPIWMTTYFWGSSGLPFEIGLVWHAHEMIYGYGGAIIAGFLLTAVPNWTGRLPLRGGRLAALFALWLAGRLVLLSNWGHGAFGAFADSMFLVVLTAFIGREVIISRNQRNAKIAVIIGLLAASNIGFHVSQNFEFLTFHQMSRLGLAIILLLILVIGGRVTPTFTRNWLVNRGESLMPVSFNRFDSVVIAFSGLALAGWIFWSDFTGTGVLLLLAGMLNVWRLMRWKFWMTFAEPLVTILHIGYAWAALAFLLSGLAIIFPEHVPVVAGVHAVGTGAIGVMTLAIMTRATLGHSGRSLRASMGTIVIYISINLAAALRVMTPFAHNDYQDTIALLSAGFWMLAFSLFCIVYAACLWLPRR